MIIQYYGKQFVKLQQGDRVVAINPLSKENTLKKKPVRFGADVVLSSMYHPDFNGFSTVQMAGKEPFIISHPGMYEVRSLTVHGYGHPATHEGKEYRNVVYFFEMDGIQFAVLGGMSDENLSQEAKEHVEAVDVIFVPIGGKGTLDPVQAAKVIKDFSPKVIIPLDYGKDREKGTLELFLREMGETNEEALEKFVFKKKDLETLSGKVIVLKEQ